MFYSGEMPKKRRDWLVAGCLLICLSFGMMAAEPVQAAPADDIVAAAKAAYMSGQDLNSVLSQAWTSAAANGLQPFEIAGLLGSMLMESGVRDKGQDPNSLPCLITRAMLTTLQGRVNTAGLSQDEMYRGFSEAVIGIRTAARALPGVSEIMITKCVNDTTEDFVKQNTELGPLTIIAENAINTPTAEAYSPPGGATGPWIAGVMGQGYGQGGRFGRGGAGGAGGAGGGGNPNPPGKPISPNK